MIWLSSKPYDSNARVKIKTCHSLKGVRPSELSIEDPKVRHGSHKHAVMDGMELSPQIQRASIESSTITCGLSLGFHKLSTVTLGKAGCLHSGPVSVASS